MQTFDAQPRFGSATDDRFRGRHLVSVKGYSRSEVERVFEVAHAMHEMVDLVGSVDLLKGKVLANLFYEPSTRTASSFIAAMQRLGGAVIPIHGVVFSSVSKGETLEDTVRTLEQYADVLVLRHHEQGAAARAASVLTKPLINAGDGPGEHPTQALLDLFTIQEERGSLDGVTIAMVGDLKHGRTVHSLARLAALFGARLRLVSPPTLAMPQEVLNDLAPHGITWSPHERLDEVLDEVDVLYVTRVQKERFPDEASYEALKDAYIVTPDTLARMRSDAVLMHPLPRVNEIHPGCDADPRAAYFRQMGYGMIVRMALLALVLGRA